MKLSLLILTLVVFASTNCKQHPALSINSHHEDQIIAIQPFDDYSLQEIDSVVNMISGFYHKRVMILRSRAIPSNFYNPTLGQYAADSILTLLSGLQNDTLVEIAGLTHQPIFTTREAAPVPYFDERIFGIGYQPGNACIISDSRFKTSNRVLYHHRLSIVIIHEVGHNLGLPHCNNESCIMSATNGDVTRLDKCGNDYCSECRRKLGR